MGRVAFISDIHSNLVALNAVLDDLKQFDIMEIWNLGDTIGYGPEPNGVIQKLREIDATCVLGNHDAAAVGIIDTENFNPVAKLAINWTATQINNSHSEWLKKLPQIHEQHDWIFTHGTLRSPLWEYLIEKNTILAHFSIQKNRFSAVGHTHLPAITSLNEQGEISTTRPLENNTIMKPNGLKVCLNPGSVGQPRNGDPRASYALADLATGEVEFRRVAYDLKKTQQAIRKNQLPEWLALRLENGT
tara:strand:- start:916 stop:1653 length:738 start_codon:yes stop_codon:yes gene_type:complete